MTSGELAVSGMASADAMQKAYMGSAIASKVLIMGGICGIITSWNSFYVGCSHAICAMAEEGMLPFKQEEEKLTRRYQRKESVERIQMIRNFREAGKTIPEIKRFTSR